MADAPLRLALLGCGRAAGMHAKALRALGPAVELYYASRDPERARASAERGGGRGAFGSYEAALGSPAVDAAVVLTPPPQHLRWTLAALDAGKHVVVEKPPFLRSSDFDAVEEKARGRGLRVLVAENYHYKPLVASLRRLVETGAIGPVRFVCVNALKLQRASGWRASRDAAGGGPLFEGGIHWVDLMASVGLTVRSACGLAPRPGALPGRSIVALFEYSGGAMGTLLHSWDAPSLLRGLRLSRVHGREGSIVFESNGLFVAVGGRSPRLLVPRSWRDIEGRVAMWRDFARCLREGGEPRMSLARARRDLELVECIYASLPDALRRVA